MPTDRQSMPFWLNALLNATTFKDFLRACEILYLEISIDQLFSRGYTNNHHAKKKIVVTVDNLVKNKIEAALLDEKNEEFTFTLSAAKLLCRIKLFQAQLHIEKKNNPELEHHIAEMTCELIVTVIMQHLIDDDQRKQVIELYHRAITFRLTNTLTSGLRLIEYELEQMENAKNNPFYCYVVSPLKTAMFHETLGDNKFPFTNEAENRKKLLASKRGVKNALANMKQIVRENIRLTGDCLQRLLQIYTLTMQSCVIAPLYQLHQDQHFLLVLTEGISDLANQLIDVGKPSTYKQVNTGVMSNLRLFSQHDDIIYNEPEKCAIALKPVK